MFETVYSSDEWPPGERFDRWREMITQSYLPSVVSCDEAADFRGVARVLQAGPVHVATLRLPALQVLRTPVHVRRFDPDQYQLAVTLQGRRTMAQSGLEVAPEVGTSYSTTPRIRTSRGCCLTGARSRRSPWAYREPPCPCHGRRSTGCLRRRWPEVRGSGAPRAVPGTPGRRVGVLPSAGHRTAGHGGPGPCHGNTGSSHGDWRRCPAGEPSERTAGQHQCLHRAPAGHRPAVARPRRRRAPHLRTPASPALSAPGDDGERVDPAPQAGALPPRSPRPPPRRAAGPRGGGTVGFQVRGGLQPGLQDRLRNPTGRLPAAKPAGADQAAGLKPPDPTRCRPVPRLSTAPALDGRDEGAHLSRASRPRHREPGHALLGAAAVYAHTATRRSSTAT